MSGESTEILKYIQGQKFIDMPYVIHTVLNLHLKKHIHVKKLIYCKSKQATCILQIVIQYSHNVYLIHVEIKNAWKRFEKP